MRKRGSQRRSFRAIILDKFPLSRYPLKINTFHMKNSISDNDTPTGKKSGFGCLQILGIALITVVIIGLIVAGWVKYNIYASEHTPTKLEPEEQKILDTKLNRLEKSAKEEPAVRIRQEHDTTDRLVPEPYSEKWAKREIDLTEKELNSIIADSPETARMVAIDLSEDLISITLVVPVDEEIILLGGKTLRINLGMVLSYDRDELVVALKGISLGGIPLPNAWLGYLKNKNLVGEFGDEGGFWSIFAAGIKDIKVRNGHIRVHLRE